MELGDLAKRRGEWLRGRGPHSDIVISSRVRLARNLTDFPFVGRADDDDRTMITKSLREVVQKLWDEDGLIYADLEKISPVERDLLIERQLISSELARRDGARGAAIDAKERFSLMVNEEDHLRIQAIRSGLALEEAWEQVDKIDDQVEELVSYAYDDQFGYLTACPTNVGTGLRVSVMMHLPGLVLTRQIDHVFRSMQKINLAVRGWHGEGSQSLGDFYQISNQITLGRSEKELIEQVGEVVPYIITYERKARETLADEREEMLNDRVFRAIGLLRTAHTISREEAMKYLSGARLGIHLGLIDDVDISALNDVLLEIQPAHIQKKMGREMEAGERDVERARLLRARFNPN